MKVLFLDIDGVLNHYKFYKERQNMAEIKSLSYPLYEFSPDSINYLNEIIEKTDAKIVLTSTWRLDGIEKMNNIFNKVGIKYPIYDFTPDLLNVYNTTLCRGKEIDLYLKEHNDIDKYVILDDDNDMEEYQLPFFIKTNAYGSGLNKTIKNKVIKILNK